MLSIFPRSLCTCVLWWIHSGADEMHSIFPRSPPAFCGEYTQAHQLRILWWIHSGADEMHSIFHRSPPAFCGEYTQALIGLDSIVSRGPPKNQHTTSVVLFRLGARRRSECESATWLSVQLTWRSLNTSRVISPRLQESSKTAEVILRRRRWRCSANNLELGTPEAVQALDNNLEMRFNQTER